MSKYDIFLTGGGGFIAKTILPELRESHSILSLEHNQADIKNQLDLHDVFLNNKFETVIHTASKGGRKNLEDTSKDFYDNLLMLNNLLEYQSKYKFKLIVFSSGAEYDRRGNIFNEKEGFFNSIPVDYYGLSKFIQTRIIKNKDNIINLRLFNVFSEIGQKDSFVYSTIEKCLNNKNIIIWEDKFFSFFYGKDLSRLINYSISNFSKYTELNCVYPSLYKLSDIAKLIKKLTKSTSFIIIEKNIGKNYHGNGDKLNALNLQFEGLNYGINNCINYQNENNNKI